MHSTHTLLKGKSQEGADIWTAKFFRFNNEKCILLEQKWYFHEILTHIWYRDSLPSIKYVNYLDDLSFLISKKKPTYSWYFYWSSWKIKNEDFCHGKTAFMLFLDEKVFHKIHIVNFSPYQSLKFLQFIFFQILRKSMYHIYRLLLHHLIWKNYSLNLKFDMKSWIMDFCFCFTKEKTHTEQLFL